MFALDSLSDLLKKEPLFAGLAEDTLRVLQSNMRLVEFGDGETLCREGDVGDRMFLVAKGQICILKRNGDDQDVEINTLKTGDIAGVLSLLGSDRRSASMVARGALQVWEIDSGTFTKLLQEHDGFARQIISELSKYVRNQAELLVGLESRKPDHRYKVGVFDSKPYIEKVLVQQNADRFALHFFEVKLTSETVSLAVGCQAVCVFVNDRLDESVIVRLKQLGVELIALRCAGFNNVDLKACQKNGLTVARVPAYSPHAVAEHAVALMMALNRRIHQAYNRVRDGNFSLNNLVGFDMHGKTAAVIGTGKIGACAARILLGFGCKVLVYNRSVSTELQALGAVFTSLDQIYQEADIISLHLPLDPTTRHIIGNEAIGKMKPGVMIINTGRGALIDTKALIKGLIERKIGSAGLDVIEEEGDYFFEDFSSSLISNGLLAQLLRFSNVLVTGHMGFLTNEALIKIADTTLENISEFQNPNRTSPLLNEVNSMKPPIDRG